MFTKFNKQIKTIFLDPASASFTLDESVNVILSPSLYWVKKVSLPIKYVREAKSLLPSLFEDTLPDGTYSYSVYKKDDDFFIFAYEDKLILETLSQKGISPTKVNSVCFAQSELNNIDGAIKINEFQSIYIKDDIVILVPCCWIEESGTLNIANVTLSKHRIKLKQFSHIVNDKSLYMLASIFTLLILLMSVEYFITEQKLSSTLELKDELFEKNGLKSTIMQNRSMLKEYKRTHLTQMKLRELMAVVLSFKLKKDEKLSLINLKGKKLIVEIDGVKNSDEIKKVIKSKNIKYKSTLKDKSLHLEIEI